MIPRASILIAAVLLTSACASDPPRSTRMTIPDLQDMAAAMAQSLAASPAIAQRAPESDPWIVSIDKVLNLTSDVMTPAEQWAVMHDLRSSTPLQTLYQEKNIRFILPPERLAAMRNDSDAPGEFESLGVNRTPPTHTMTATFRSITRAQAEQRTDLYYAEFEILNHATAEPVWIDRFEYKREATGHVWD